MPDQSVPDTRLFQICVIVDDLERYAENWRTILGFDVPSDVQVTREHAHTQATYRGRPMEARGKIVSWPLGEIHFELLQPLDEGSVWMDFLRAHGPGLQHVALLVPRIAPAAAVFADRGFRVTQQGLFTGRSGAYAYLSTEDSLGLALELLEHYEGGAWPTARPFPEDRGLGTDRVTQVGLVVNDLDEAVRRYRETFDLPEPALAETPGREVTEMTFHGEPSDATARLAFLDFGPVDVELIQPDREPSVWRQHLDRHGNSAQHLAFRVKDTGEVVDRLSKHGIGVLQQGLYGDRSGMYTYLDTQAALGVTLELLESFPAPR
ncbi:MAG TPA: VOC family protein [Deinococcales bacterium]|nr:VOC family protein [Deinococcales bacterium]